ncbi:MAG: LptF/LptG family permease [Rikenellaceae bacterium]|jgi:lipopolysaccharide export system permease protein|nr:LptF/LptG family permease [Rikenellaceae bacterium]
MKTVHKFVLKSYLGPMVLTFFIVMFVLLMQFLWRYIDELVGKGISVGTISELMLYALAGLIPMGLPLATMLAAIMTMGNLGENYELLAMKSAGMSLPQIMAPLIVVASLVAVGSFFVANNLVPYSNRKIFSLLYDISHQKQAIEFKDGIFFNGIENMSIRVGHQDLRTKLLRDVLIYDTRNMSGNMSTTLADSGYIRLSDDKRYLLVTLYNGAMYEQTRNKYQWYDKNTFKQNRFDKQDATIPLSGFDFERSNPEMFNNSQTKNITELEHEIDSLSIEVGKATKQSYEPLLTGYFFTRDHNLASNATGKYRSAHPGAYLPDSLKNMDVYKRRDLYNEARNLANSSRGFFTFDEQTAKDNLTSLYKYRVEWHRKMLLPISVLIFFLIGAPLGAIIRKGGLGMPIVVSVLFFIIYYIVSITGEKMAREGTWDSFSGMWLATGILFPIAVFLTYKATNDSNLFNIEVMIDRINKIKQLFKCK